MAGKFALFLYVLVLLWLAAGIAAMQVSPQVFWPLGFLAFSTPAPLLLNVVFLLYWLFRLSWAALLPVLVVGVVWPYYRRGITISRQPDPVPAQANRVQVLNFNVQVFNVYQHLREQHPHSSDSVIAWVANHPADILLLQEYYNVPGSKVYAATQKIAEAQGREPLVAVIHKDKAKQEFGLAIFSRYPIVHQDRLNFHQHSLNQAMFADIKVNADTIRVYNVHLQSMAISDEAVAATLRGERIRSEGKNTIKRLRYGFLERSRQVDKLVEHIASSPYPVVVGGDLNDIPWSYTYEQLALCLHNAFEVRGSGLGQTYNGKIPFLRIDHQFYSDGLQPRQFTIHREMPYSDHFPVSVVYSISE